MTEAALFDLDTRAGREDVCHVLLPNMAYACDGSILTKRGTFRCGAHDWDAITCPDCRARGQRVLIQEVQEQQGRQADVR